MTDSLRKLARTSSQSSGMKRNSTAIAAIQPSSSKIFEGSSFQSDGYEKSDTAYRRAYNSLNIVDIFQYLECLVEDETSRKKKLAQTEIKELGGEMVIRNYMESQRLLTKRISKFINVIESYRSVKKIELFSQLFYNYMVESGIDEQTNFLTAEKIYAYKQLLSTYIHSPFLTTEANTKLEGKATNLFNFFDQYRVDCYSCLTGMEPSEPIIDLLLHNKSTSMFESADAEEMSQSNAEMYNEILCWASSAEPPEMILRNVKKFAAILRGVNKLKTGDMVVVEISNNRYIYARFSGTLTAERGMINLFMDAEETEVTVKIDRVWPLIGSITKYIAENLPVRYEKLVTSPLDPLFTDLMQFSTDIIKGKLSSFGIDAAFLSRANQNQCSLLDLSLLKQGLKELDELLPPPEDLLEEVGDNMKITIDKYMEKLDLNTLFQPTKNAIIKQLESFSANSLLVMVLQRYKGVLQSALDQINLQKRELMNGTRKKQLVEWWLLLVRRLVVKKLVSKKFDVNAVPENYTSIPPADFRSVYKNIGILREALNLDNDVHQIKEMIQDICGEIYPKIVAFVVDAKVAILEVLGRPCDKEAVAAFDLEELIAMTAEMENEEEDSQNEWMSNLIKDLQYLTIMVGLEGAPEEERQKHFHIVPISGLIISRLCRMENEHKTVLELWAPVAYVKKLSGTYQRSPLHRAISTNDFRQVKNLIKESNKQKKENNPNEQDQHGWTPLHCAASSEEKLPICKILIESGASINIPNNDGNTPLHYLARCNVSTPERQETQIQILREMIKSGGDVNAMNDLGETPLHNSCFLGNVEIARILLEAYADPNTITKEGESCLHYAVQARHADLVTILLEFGANPYLRCNGKNPIDLAYKFHVPEITEIFRTVPMICEVGEGQSFAPRARSSSSLIASMSAEKKKKKKSKPGAKTKSPLAQETLKNSF